ncbi:MAG: DUF4952 domain-containing protein [Achromobacter sp.]|uniref:DUF4952 domain-containing protein n=1 Tax=Achromobacter sp. TaxID=134375 RepID=UPI0029BF811B|nr:DUF4952 domain-containing protein [Achromobacter sp.]MDX3988639.1 DUF4952 domain-containing protein [Achromobacter sp.]
MTSDGVAAAAAPAASASTAAASAAAASAAAASAATASAAAATAASAPAAAASAAAAPAAAASAAAASTAGASGDTLARWEADDRAAGIAPPDTPCQDFLQTLGRKPDYLEYLGCEQDDDSYIQPMRANYRVSGSSAVKLEAYLMQAFGMPALEYVCCGWASPAPFAWRAGPGGVAYDIGMGVETPRLPRAQWDQIPSFNVSVGIVRKSP